MRTQSKIHIPERRGTTSKADKPISRIYVLTEDHQRVSLFARRQGMNPRDVYSLLIEAFLDHDGKLRSEATVYVPISLEAFKKLSKKAEGYKVTERVLITAMIDLADSYSELFKGRLF